MKAWEVWQYAFPWGEHPAVVVSNPMRVALKPQVVVLSCRTMKPQAFRDAEAHECLLDETDGMDWKTLCRCDLLYTVDKALLKNRRGQVTAERRTDIARKIIAGLAFAGL